MKILNNYLQELQEDNKIELGKGGIKRKPSPTFAYEVVYKKQVPGGWRRGRFPGKYETKTWRGIEVDSHLEDKWLDDLNKIKIIEMRGSCEGHSKDWITYIAFRLDPKHDKDKLYLDKVAKNLSKDKRTVCDWDIGTQERPRFVCAAKLWYGEKEWESWWDTLASRIKKAVPK